MLRERPGKTVDELISANHRKVLWGVYAYVAISLSLTVIIAVWLLTNRESSSGWIIFALLIIVEVCSICLATASGLRMVMWLSGAEPIGGKGLLLAEDVVDDMALAAGVPSPEVMFIDQGFCNAFSMKLGKRAAIFITRGMTEKLDKEELRGVIGHEMAHLYQGDATFNTFLASLRGFYMDVRLILSSIFSEQTVMVMMLIAVCVALGLILTLAALLTIETVGPSGIYDWTKRILLLLAPVFMIALNMIAAFILAGIMQRFIDDSRDLLADETSVRWTMNPEALIRAMQKADHEGHSARLRFLKDIFFIPMALKGKELTVNDRVRHLDQSLHIGMDSSSLSTATNRPDTGAGKTMAGWAHGLRRLAIASCIILACAGLFYIAHVVVERGRAAEMVVPIPPGWQDVGQSDPWGEKYWKERGGSEVDAYYSLKPDTQREYRDNTTILAYHDASSKAPDKKILCEAEVQDVLNENRNSFTGGWRGPEHERALKYVGVDYFDCGEYAVHVRYSDPDYGTNCDRYHIFKNGYEYHLTVYSRPAETEDVLEFLKQSVSFK